MRKQTESAKEGQREGEGCTQQIKNYSRSSRDPLPFSPPPPPTVFRVPLTFGQSSAQAPPGEVLDIGAVAISNRMKMRHWAAVDHMTAAHARLGHLLAKRSRPATLNVGDLVWLDSRHTPNDIPFKLTARWFGPFKSRVPRLHCIYHLRLARHIVRSKFRV